MNDLIWRSERLENVSSRGKALVRMVFIYVFSKRGRDFCGFLKLDGFIWVYASLMA